MREESSCARNLNSLMGEAECQRLSSGSSVGSPDPRASDCGSLSSTEDGRPLSTVSSSGSAVEGTGDSSTTLTAGVHLHLEPSSPQGSLEPPELLGLGSPFASVTMAPNPQLTHVDRVVMEIIETERMYVMDLRSIVEDYLVHIIDTTDLPIKPEQVCSLFGNIEHIYEFNSELLQCLDLCASDPVAIARCFVDKSEYFEIYTQYCTNYPNSVAVLTDCLRNKTLAKFFRDRQASLRRSLPLGSYLLKPVQRILKYHLLLQEIAKHFDRSQAGFDVVTEAIESMTGVAWYINDMKRKHEHAVRLQEVQSLLINWKGADLCTYGELVLEGTFHVQRAKNERTLFLFDKMLLITKKRGEHYVYKTHISCSTLMLIESAKDLLRFSVTHYKHPKQPHTVQARTVEEKKLWAHHIKRLILENHHAVIPQKAKDAILDMHSAGPVKYRYSPDRLKSTSSCQNEDFSTDAVKERRRSEPAKRSVRSNKDTLKHAESEGALLADKQHLSALHTEKTNPDQAENGHESSSGSLDEVKAVQEERGEQGLMENEEQGLMGNEQVADFASSVMAAISCWRYRAKALLSDHVTTDREGCWESWSMNKSGKTPEEKPEDTSEALIVFGQATREHSSSKVFSLLREPEDTDMDQSDNYPEMCGTVMAGCHTDPEIVDLGNGGQEIGDNMRNLIDFSSNATLEMQEKKEETPLNDVMKIEVEENIAVADSNLCSYMRDKPRNISEQHSNSLSRKSSLGVKELLDLHCLSSQSESRRIFEQPENNPKSQEFTQLTQETLIESIPDNPFKPDQSHPKKQDTLSKKDRLLIHKIKRYYEHAEHLDANFAIKRRESLSYIPPGLVRNLSQQLNGFVDEDLPLQRRGSSRPTLWSVFNLTGSDSDKKAKDNSDFVVPITGKESERTEQFQRAANMVKVWKDMEVEIIEPSEEHKGLDDSQMSIPVQEKKEETRDSGLGEPLIILEESDESSSSSPIPKVPQDNEEYKSQERHRVNHPPLPRMISLRAASEDDLIFQDMEKMKNKVFQLARQYSQRIKNSKPMVKQRPKISESHFMPKSLSSVIEEKPPGKEKGMPERTLLLTLNEQDNIPDSKSTSSSSSLCSPGSPQLPYICRLYPQRPQSPVQTETFHWPDVKELCSKYNNHGHDGMSASSRFFPMGRSTSFPERFQDSGLEKSVASRSLSCSSPFCSFTVQRTTSTESACSNKTLEGEGLPSLCRVNAVDFGVGMPDTFEQPEDTLSAKNNLILVERATGGEEYNENQRSRLDAVSQDEMVNSKEQHFGAWIDGGHPSSLFEQAEHNQHSLVKNLREKFQNLSSYM
ncbi:pleckstrin homology domain-containing family G member 3 [Danio aesculapii]|uniref:pleckstrin homology domain-containing family G member 3 n=1 Tax=Danio aesculapii TaxID=1142201 RepID=UPI0024BF1733|nr:pleckstrin homology domain-containing family G member 3 [Danio aesculapii]